MKPGLRSIALGLLVGVFSLASQACAPAAETAEDDEVDEGAIKMGGRWLSPLEQGVYDSDNGMLSIINWLDKQAISSAVVTSDGLHLCHDTTADFTDGQASIQKPECSLTLKPGATKGTIAASGKLNSTGSAAPYAAIYRRRPKDALVGKYSDGKVALTVEASSEAALTFSMTIDGKLVANHETASTPLHESSSVRAPSGFAMNTFEGKTAGCPVQFSISRSKGQYGISVGKWGAITDINQCPGYVGIMSVR